MSGLSSRTHPLFPEPDSSPAKMRPVFSPNFKQPETNVPHPGTFNDGALVRTILTEAMKNCGLSRIQIAEEMSRLTGKSVTERQLNNYTADSRGEYKFPSELERAFCSATGDSRLLTSKVELAGFHVITDSDRNLMELGRKYLTRRRADAEMADLERRLEGSAI
jgi:hypothetical protein